VKLARAIDWQFLKETFGAVYSDKPGQPPLPTRLMAGLASGRHRARHRPSQGTPPYGPQSPSR
jgi:hypothetical protein